VLKGGMVFADRVTTLSPTYAKEALTATGGFGLDGVLRSRGAAFLGLAAGLDEAEWDPERDAAIPKPFDAKSLDGKAVCKATVQLECGLPEADVPLIAYAGSLDGESGADLLAEILPELSRVDAQIVILGTGAEGVEARFGKLARELSDKVALRLTQEQALLHRVVAGADLALIPARSESWATMAMACLRYGTVPIVHRTGGLADAVTDYLPSTVAAKTASGFYFEHDSAADLLKSVLLALSMYRAKKDWRQLMTTGMRADLGWAEAASGYVDLYRELVAPAP